jgi:hypothetical protein
LARQDWPVMGQLFTGHRPDRGKKMIDEPNSASQRDWEALILVLVQAAARLLQQTSDFVPFGAWMAPDGPISFLAGYSQQDSPDPEAIVEMLTQALTTKARQQQARATGICRPRWLTLRGEKIRTIGITLEHSQGQALEIFLPYQHTPSGELAYGQPLRSPASLHVFDANE